MCIVYYKYFFSNKYVLVLLLFYNVFLSIMLWNILQVPFLRAEHV